MKVMLEIKENRADFVMELLRSLPFVKVKPLSPYKEEVLEVLRKAVEEMTAIKEGRLKGIPASQLLNEL
jgi:hypothetical protein